MDSFRQITTLNHHAYCLVGSDSLYPELITVLESNKNFIAKANPDFFHEKYESLGIDESRKIKDNHSSKSFKEGNKRIFVIECKSITHEAQNSLLKIFEEPHEHTHFFIIIPSVSTLLPTLKSRLFVIEGARDEKENEMSKEVKKFFSLSTKNKITFVDDIVKRINDEEIEKSYAIEFLSVLEKIIYEKGVEKNSKAIKAILKARDYMHDRSPSVKQLLEFVALSL